MSQGLTGLAVYVAVIGESAETSTVRQLCFTPLFLIRFSQNSFVLKKILVMIDFLPNTLETFLS